MNDQIGQNLLNAALVAAQKLEKKFRQLRNRQEVADVDVDDAKECVEILRDIAIRLGVKADGDIDGRGARRKN